MRRNKKPYRNIFQFYLFSCHDKEQTKGKLHLLEGSRISRLLWNWLNSPLVFILQWARTDVPDFIVENQYFPLTACPSLLFISSQVSAGSSWIEPRELKVKNNSSLIYHYAHFLLYARLGGRGGGGTQNIFFFAWEANNEGAIHTVLSGWSIVVP